MFSKAKRFPEAGKDYIPGPGEYDLTVDDMGRHKRYGFLTQTNRFIDPSLDPNDHNEEDHTQQQQQNESTTTIMSVSSDTRLSSTSSIKSDEPLKSPSRKSPTSPIDSHQKHVEALQIKLHKMEAIIESLETDKKETKALLISKDLEMADLRSKNATLQKTIHRQEISAKTGQLQKKVDGLEEQLSLLKSQHESDKQALNRSNTIQLEQRERIEALEAQNNAITVQLSECESKSVENETQINNLGEELKSIQVTHTALMHDFHMAKEHIETLVANKSELLDQIQELNDTMSHLKTCATLKDEEIDALLNTIEERDRTVEEKTAVIENIQNQFNTYRHWIDHTVIPHLRSKRKGTENHHYAELNLLLTELHEAKKFINRQAQYLDALKSDVHWLNVQNGQLSEIIADIIQDQKDFLSIKNTSTANTIKKKILSATPFKPKRKQQTKIDPIIPMNASDTATLSFSSRSTVSNDSSSKCTEIDSSDSNVVVLNDSGFGMLVEEAK